MIDACLYMGTVFHKRFSPKVHKLTYRVFTIFADLDEMGSLSEKHRFFSHNKFNLVSFHDADYGDPTAPNGTTLRDRLFGLLNDNHINTDKVKNIKVLAYPRVIGFAFNPLTVFYCFGAADEHIALIYEVRNTFGQRHNYIFQVPDGSSFEACHHSKKSFHVSPFFNNEGNYDFHLKTPDKNVAITINYGNEDGLKLTACFSGKRRKFDDRELITLSLRMPFMTLKVVAGILIEALRLKLKGLQVFKHQKNHHYQSSPAQIDVSQYKNDTGKEIK